MTYNELVKQLTADLQEAGKKNINPPSGMSDAEARDWSMKNVAEAIAKAIRDGLVFNIKGSATVIELNALPLNERGDGDIWAVKDSGLLVNPYSDSLTVTAGDLVMWVGNAWSRIFHLDLTGYATVDQLSAAVLTLTTAINDAVAAERALREAADAAEASLRSSADTALQNSITEEASTRASADEDLAQQIEDSRIDVDESLDTESTNPVENRAVTAAVNGKQDQLTEMTDQEVNDLINSL